MLNIEIYGYSTTENLEILKALSSDIESALDRLGINRKDVVVTIVESAVNSCWRDKQTDKQRKMPFIRVCSTNQQERHDIATTLHHALRHMDIETLAIEEFFAGHQSTCW